MNRIPDIRCGACGAIIGNKFIQFNRLVECGSTKLEAFQSLDIYQYCCKKKLVNPIILSNKVDSPLPPLRKKESELKTSSDTPDRTINIDLFGCNPNKLTNSIGREVPVVPLSHSGNLDEDYLDSLKAELRISLNSSHIKDIPFSRKDIDLSQVFESSILSNKTTVGTDSGYEVSRKNRTYEAK